MNLKAEWDVCGGCRKVSGEAGILWARRASAITWLSVVACCLLGEGWRGLSAATVPVGFTETEISGPWSDAVGTAFENNGRMYVWERTGKVWFKDPGDPSYSLLLDISEEVGAWEDHGMLGFALDPEFRVNGRIYLLYVVDRYYLLNFGLPGYNPNSNQYDDATIGRVTRYTCTSSNGFRSVDPASRVILIGETKQTGFPIVSYTHGVGSLVFGEDGTLLVSCGDGATADTADQGGAQSGSYAAQGLTDGIIRAKEDIGALRSQLVDCLNGKVLRIDPATGNGLSSNPFYDATHPRSARSRVWALGLRNPCRMSLKPESGSHYPADGNPGILYVGDVGWNSWECLRIVTGPGQNSGWPLYEGLSLTDGYDGAVGNQDAPNPLAGGACDPYFTFAALLKEDTLAAAGQPPFNNPCNTSQKIPGSIPQFLHKRPVLDWNHASAITRTPTYGGSGQAQMANVGAGGSPVSGTQFQGNCAIGGTWYTGTNFPAAYQNKYFFADWGQGLIKYLTLDANDKPVALGDFARDAGQIVSVVAHPTDGSLYYINYNFTGSTIQQLVYTGNRMPLAVASADKYYGPGPLAVQFSSNGSSDPDGQPITYSWNFGDGSAVSPQADPAHTFTAPAGVPTKYVVTLTVTDSGGLAAQKTLIVSVNNTPPSVTIASPVDGSLYSSSNATTVNLAATVTDAQSSDSQLLYQWQVLLHHNDHNHGNPADTNHVSSAVIEPTGCDGINIYYYRILLTVTDPAGLATVREVRLFPNCGPNLPPVISGITNQTVRENVATAPIGFTIGDAETPAVNLQLSAGSSNPVLVPTNSIVFDGSGSNRTVTVNPAAGQTGSATITVTVNDGPHDTSTAFVLTINPSIALTGSFTNAGAITIPSIGSATPYPSTINVTGMSGTITNVTVTLRGLSHSWGSDIDVLLVGPGGQKATLMSDAGTGPTASGANLTFSDAAAGTLPETGSLVSGTYQPTDYLPADTYPAPAPAGPYGTALSAFNGQSANGAWSLYVVDGGAGDSGSFAGGWSLTVTTLSAASSVTPTISDIPDQSTTANTPTAAIPFTIADADTPVANLTMGRNSSNVTLVPTNNIVFGGSGSNRTVTVTPATGQTGTATITVTVSDGTNSAGDAFVLTVNAVNTPPTITGISNQTINEDTATAALSFMVGDAETAAGSLTLSKASSNPALVPTNNVVFGGSGSNRTVTVTPAADQNGTSTITMSVSDGQYSVSTNFVVTVNGVNDPPTITGIANQTINMNRTVGPLSFTIGDVDTPLANLTLSAGSSNPVLVPTNSIVFGGSDSNRTVTVTPAAGQTGSATITVTVNDGPHNINTNFVLNVNEPFDPYPLKVSGSNGRLLVDQSDVPFLLIADAPHSLLVNLDDADAALYLADRATNGFNSLWAQLLCVEYTFGRDDGSMLDGTTPFTNTLPEGSWDLTTPNEAYFAHVDKVLRMAGSNGLQVLLTPLETGGLTDTALANGTNRCRQFGQYLGNRYKDFPNLIWQHGNDFQTWSDPGDDAVVSAIALGINDQDTNHLQSVQLNFTVSASLDDPTWWPIVSYDTVYTYSPTYDKVLTEYQWTNQIPIWMIEGHYEFEELQGELGTPAVLRRQTYWTLTSGAIGYGYGSGYTDSFQNGWKDPANLDSVGVRELNYATALFRSREWYDFVPDTNHTILTAGYGTYETSGNVSDSDYATCAREKHGHTVVVYAPTQRAMTMDMTKVSGSSAKAWWFNPQTGIATNFGTYATSGTQNFAPPTADNWVLVLDDAAQNFPAPGAAPLIYPLQIPLTSLPNGQTGLLFSVQFTAIGGTRPYTWSLAPGSGPLPGGLDLSADGVLSGTPTASGTFAFTVRATDAGTMTADQPLTLSVNGLNTPPTITGLADQMIDEDTATGALNFTVGDGQSTAGSLTLSKGSSNPTLVPINNIVFGGSGANRTVTVSPTPNGNGAATITVTVSDGQLSAGTNFVVTVNAVNDPPTITGMADQTIAVNSTTGSLNFTIGDVETEAGSLSLNRNSSNPTLVPTNNIVFGGSGSNRTVTVTPATGLSGTATITVSVSDGQTNTSTSFVLTVSSSIGATTSFTNATPLTIPDQGAASSYPSTINLSGLSGIITNVTVSLMGLTHTWKADLDMLLVSPGGQKVILMSDAGGAYTPSGSVTLTLSDAAAVSLPASTAISSGTYQPTNYTDASPGGDNFPAPAPGAPFATTLSTFNGQSPNGTWSLYVFDDGPNDLGSLAGGWSLTLTMMATQQIPVITWTNPAAITYGTALSGVQLNATASVPGTFAYNPASGTMLNAGNAQGLNVTFTPSDMQTYALATRTVLINVGKAPLSVVANNATRVYGQTNPGFTATLTGVHNGDNITASNSSPATIESPVGSYAIVPTLMDPDGKLVNYAVASINGVLTIIDLPRLVKINESANGTFVIECSGYAGRSYRFQYKDNLLDSNWADLGATQTAVSSSLVITNNVNAMPQRFYRLRDVTDP